MPQFNIFDKAGSWLCASETRSERYTIVFVWRTAPQVPARSQGCTPPRAIW